MSARHADGQPFVGDLIAVLDETSPAVGAGNYYVVSSAVIMSVGDVESALRSLFSETPDRTRPFHWHKEGPQARERMLDLITSHGIVAVSRYQSVGRKGQAKARQLLLPHVADALAAEQVDHLVIESGDATTDGRDRATLLDHFRDQGGVPFTYDWRTKNEAVLWIADAINGVIHDAFATGTTSPLELLIEANVLAGHPEYLA